MMADVNGISDEVLTKSIREIISSADLNVMTSKLVRNELKIKLNVEDLDSRKKQINSIINEVINDLSKTKDKSIKAKDIKSEPINDIKIKIEEKPKNDKSNVINDSNESEDSSSDDSLHKDLSDEQLARKLHNEELGPKLRRGRSKATKKTTKKKNKESDKSDKPKKKGGNGYTKPCALSPDLAEFLGEREMARHEVVKRIWSYVRENDLFDPKNKQFAICDNQMSKIFGRKRVRMFGMMKFLGKHFI